MGLDVHDDILGAVGRTPLVRLDRFDADSRTRLWAKVEYLNPGGSIKDRVAVAMLDAAESEGRLRPGDTIVEPTSGNTGVGLAIVGRLRGYHVVAVMPDKISEEKRALLRAYGAEVVVCPTAVEPDDPASYYSVSDRLVRERNAFKPDQYANSANPAAHYATTGPEIWEATEGRITHLVAGVGTGGTVTGAGRYLKERNPDIVVVGADPVGSIYSNERVHPYLVEGVGEDFWPGTFDPSVVDRYITVPDRDAFLTTRRLAESEGLLVGGSCGMAAHAARALSRELNDPEALVVVILPDGGRGYMSKIFNDRWMSEHGFLPERTLGDLLRDKRGSDRIPDLVSVRRDRPIREAIETMRLHGISQMPVIDGGRLVGSVVESGLVGLLPAGGSSEGAASPLDEPVESIMRAPLETAADVVGVSAASEMLLEGAGALVVVDGERPIGIVSSIDLLADSAR